MFVLDALSAVRQQWTRPRSRLNRARGVLAHRGIQCE